MAPSGTTTAAPGALMASGTSNHLWAVWGTSSSNVFAVGANGTILRYNGSAWSSMDSSSAGMMPGTDHTLFAVWGSSPSDVFAVGYKNILLHYNGSAWSNMGSPILYPGDVWGTSSSDVFIVGAFANIWKYNGSVWNEMSSGTTISPTASMLNGIWGSSSSDIFAVGAGGTILHYHSSSAGNVTATVASTPFYTGAPNEYNLYVMITSTTVPGLVVGQQVFCAASTTDFPNLLTIGATLTGTLDNSLGWWVLKSGTVVPPPPPATGNTIGTVARTPFPTGAANEYNLYLTITSTTVPGLVAGQRVLCAATTTDFPNLLTVGATLTGTLNNSLGWWVLKSGTVVPPPPPPPPAAGNTIGTVTRTPFPTGAANEYNLYLTITSTTVPGLVAGQRVLCAATTTDFPNLLTVGATLTGTLDHSPGWWVLKK